MTEEDVAFLRGTFGHWPLNQGDWAVPSRENPNDFTPIDVRLGTCTRFARAPRGVTAHARDRHGPFRSTLLVTDPSRVTRALEILNQNCIDLPCVLDQSLEFASKTNYASKACFQ
jgi:hypothetical protein